MTELEPIIRSCLKEVSLNAYSKADVGLDDNLYDRGILDSLTTVQFIIDLEKKLNIKISNSDISYESFSSIRELLKLLDPKSP